MDVVFPLGTIYLWAADWEPYGFRFCQGQLLLINNNSNLFKILGNRYGGDGVNNFALPNLCSRIPVGVGQGPQLSNYALGATGGVTGVSLTIDQIPKHTHGMGSVTSNIKLEGVTALPTQIQGATGYMPVNSNTGNSVTPGATSVPSQTAPVNGVDNYLYGPPSGNLEISTSQLTTASLRGGWNGGSFSVALENYGGGAPHDNMQPTLGLNYIIAVMGT